MKKKWILEIMMNAWNDNLHVCMFNPEKNGTDEFICRAGIQTHI